MVLITNYGGSGFTVVRHAGAKLFDVTGGDEAARPLAEWHHYSPFEKEANVTQLALLKVSTPLHRLTRSDRCAAHSQMLSKHNPTWNEELCHLEYHVP